MSLNWEAQLLRLSIFSNDAMLPSEALWKALTGEEEAQNRITTPGGKAYTGPFSGGQLAIHFGGQRIDVVLSPPEATSPEDSLKFQTAGDLASSLADFAKASKSFLESNSYSISRIAFAASLLAPTESREAGYEYLAELLTSVAMNSKMRDVMFRCNWPRESKVKRGLEINRLTTWAVVQTVSKVIQVTGTQTTIADSGEGAMAVRLDIDNNTDAANSTAFNKSELVPIFEELVQLAVENAENGEVQ